VLRRESQRIATLLHRRRKATLWIFVVFALATGAAGVLLAQFVRQQQGQIQILSRRLEAANQQVQSQRAWLADFQRRGIRVDSILDHHETLMSASERRVTSYADDLIGTTVTAIRGEFGTADAGLQRDFRSASQQLRTDFSTAIQPLFAQLAGLQGSVEEVSATARAAAETAQAHTQAINGLSASTESDRRGTTSALAEMRAAVTETTGEVRALRTRLEEKDREIEAEVGAVRSVVSRLQARTPPDSVPSNR
jgi:chromosome segregation ATPase